MQILLITPPFTQLNTPYPATAYIKGYLNTQGIKATQMDLGLDVILEIFSEQGLREVFDRAAPSMTDKSENAHRIYTLREDYLRTIGPTMRFLQGLDDTLAHFICERHFLPEASKFDQVEGLDWAFGTMGVRDLARHLATLYLEDLGDFITEVLDPYFGFSRYAERLSSSATSFDPIWEALETEDSFITQCMLQLLDKTLSTQKPDLVCLSVPFPGNLFAALKCGQWIKRHYPDTKVAMGGGYPNTELRSLTEPRVFDCVDYITLDDGEMPLKLLVDHLQGRCPAPLLKRTYALEDGRVSYHNGSLHADVPQAEVGTPDYEGLPLRKYLSVIQLTNPMHRMWSDGRWSKLTMAHGCYWGKCTFCDISLDYIRHYEASSATLIVDRMETLIEQTGERGFHFVDEAAPPALMKAVAIEILKRKLIVSWWTNIRFEKSFHADLCRLLAASGCIAVSGGLEVASDRLLTLIDKGVTIEQVTQVTAAFTEAGIMVHAYLMYGFPTQTDQETIDSLEVVRQLFEAGVLLSGFWHRFAMTAHSPVGMDPDKFKVQISGGDTGSFARNDLEHVDPTGGDHARFSAGLRKSLYNYMHGVGLDLPLSSWFDHVVPDTTIPADLIQRHLARPQGREIKPSSPTYWMGGTVAYGEGRLRVTTKSETADITIDAEIGVRLAAIIEEMVEKGRPMTYGKLRQILGEVGDATLIWYGTEMEQLRRLGLLVL